MAVMSDLTIATYCSTATVLCEKRNNIAEKQTISNLYKQNICCIVVVSVRNSNTYVHIPI